MSKKKVSLGAAAAAAVLFAFALVACVAQPEVAVQEPVVEIEAPFGDFTGTVSNADNPSQGYMTEEGTRSSPAGRFGATDFVITLHIEDGWIVDVDFEGSDTLCGWVTLYENPQRLGPDFSRVRHFILTNQSFENFPVAPRDVDVEPSGITVDVGTGATYTRQTIREAGERALEGLL
ncbi:MAG: hypothetical protein FWG66_12615 [Spirochaetes bacterium]|nr:hypothetical protein [Spirochaetota bacterium]